MDKGGTLANLAGGSIEGDVGVYVNSVAATVTNAGLIGGDHYSVQFASPGDLLVARTGARFVGVAAGGGGALDLAGMTGTISGLGGSATVAGSVSGVFESFSSYAIAGRWTLAGIDALASKQTLSVAGDLAVTGKVNLAAAGAIDVLAGGELSFLGGGEILSGAITGAGALSFAAGSVVLNGASLSVARAMISGAAVTLTGTVVNSGALIITTGSVSGRGTTSLINQTTGTISGAGPLSVVLASAVVNDGLLQTRGGGLIVTGPVSGSGRCVVDSGTLGFGSVFSQDVTFAGKSGVLQLARSQEYHGTITGFSTAGATALDLRDIAFVGAGEASFSGTASSGVLTVSDGTHTARIALMGDYLGQTFVSAADGHGGVVITDKGKSAPAALPLVAAMATLAPSASGSCPKIVQHASWRAPPLLANVPRLV